MLVQKKVYIALNCQLNKSYYYRYFVLQIMDSNASTIKEHCKNWLISKTYVGGKHKERGIFSPMLTRNTCI